MKSALSEALSRSSYLVGVRSSYVNITDMLSAKAKAFCVENLLGLRQEEDAVKAPDTRKSVVNGIPCPVAHGGQACIHPSTLTVYDNKESSCIKVELCQNELWHSFHSLGTEMIITKSGRRMFPAIRMKLHGLDPDSKYIISLEFAQIDKQKYRYVYHSSKWMVSGTGEHMKQNQMFHHPDSPIDSSYLNSQIVSFERVKLTNNDKPKHGQVSLVSMQRFIPRVHIQSVDTDGNTRKHFTATFPQTAFIAVTAYQNQEITRLKIARNPFAKGFREAGKNRSTLEAMIESYGYQITNRELTQTSPVHVGIKSHVIEDNKSEKNVFLGVNNSSVLSPRLMPVGFTFPIPDLQTTIKEEVITDQDKSGTSLISTNFKMPTIIPGSQNVRHYVYPRKCYTYETFQPRCWQKVLYDAPKVSDVSAPTTSNCITIPEQYSYWKTTDPSVKMLYKEVL